MIFLGIKAIGILGSLLKFVAIPMLVLALIVKPKVVINYGKWLLNSLQQNLLLGAVFTILSIVAFPFVSAFLLVKALMYDKLKNFKFNVPGMPQQEQTEDVDFEILDERPLDISKKKVEQRR